MTLVAAVALGSSTFAWFVNNTQVTATDVTVTATTANSLQIKHYESGSYGTTTPLNTGNIYLVPVSTVGATGNALPSFFKSNEWDKNANVKSFIDATVTDVNNSTDNNLTSVSYTSDEVPGSPYYVDTVYFKAGQTSNLYFDATTTGLVGKDAEGVQTILSKFNASTNDLVKAMRIGVLVSNPDGSNGKFFVYQLNSTVSTNKANTTATTLSVASADGLKAGVTSTNDTAAFTTDNIVTFANNTLPTLDSQAINGDPAAMVANVPSTTLPLYNFSVTGTDDKAECKAVIYIWMEGCDYDTVAANTTAFSAFANKIQLGFCLGTAATADE